MTTNDALRKQLDQLRRKLPETVEGYLTLEGVAQRLDCTSAEALELFASDFERG